VALIRTDVSEDRIASIFRVRVCEQAQSEVVSSCIGNDSQSEVVSSCIGNDSVSYESLEAIRSSETSVLIRATRRHLPEDDNHHFMTFGHRTSYTGSLEK
jgi:hypothetical protein